MNPWKITTIAIALVTGTAFTTGLTTAYLLRPAAPAMSPSGVAASSALDPGAAATSTISHPRTTRLAPVQRAVVTQPAVAYPAVPAVRRVATTTAAADCSTSTGDRLWRIAKPGLVSGVVGAALGAAGGAIANGGKSAGKGAVIGGIAGTALGGAYGAYKTKQECGSVLGGTGFASNGASTPVATTPATQSAYATPVTADGITVYDAR